MKSLSALVVIAACLISPEGASAQLGHGTMNPLRFVFSDTPRLGISQAEIEDLPVIETAARGGGTWYEGSRDVAVSVFTSGRADGAYAIRVHLADEPVSGQSRALIPVETIEDIGNEDELEGCASTTGASNRWLPVSESESSVLQLPSSRVKATRFC